VLDFYGTLVEQHPDDVEGDRAALAALGYELTGRLKRAWIDPYFEQAHLDESVSEEHYDHAGRVRWRTVLAEAGVAQSDVDAVAALAEHRRATRRFVVYADVREALPRLRALGLRTVICSNWSWDLDGAIRRCGLDRDIDAAVCSAQVGYRKPHPEMLRLAARAIGVPASEALAVGDTYDADVVGARAAGMDAVLLVRDGVTSAPAGTITARDLLEVVTMASRAQPS
jgi:putative hydrolase of the HAD superfamily